MRKILARSDKRSVPSAKYAGKVTGSRNSFNRIKGAGRLRRRDDRCLTSKESNMSSRSSSNLSDALKVLVLDDSAPVGKLLACVIETNTGIAPIVASSAKEALELLKENAVDVVVSDLFMPEVDGFQFLLQVRERFPL